MEVCKTAMQTSACLYLPCGPEKEQGEKHLLNVCVGGMCYVVF